MEATKKIAGQSRHARKKHRVDRISAGAMPPNGRAPCEDEVRLLAPPCGDVAIVLSDSDACRLSQRDRQSAEIGIGD